EIAALRGAVIGSDDPSDAESGPDVIQAMPGSDGRRHLAEVQFFAEGKGKGTVGNREEHSRFIMLHNSFGFCGVHAAS
ncbi:hypothetical protein RhiTH_011761, partial [Rhizoctonia solani]